MNAFPFTPQELVMFEAVYRRQTRAAAGAVLVIALAILQALLLATVAIAEYALFHEVFDYLKGPSSGSDAGWSIGLLALTGTLMLLAFHLYAKERPDALAVRFIHRCVDLLLPLYALGAGLAVAAIIYFDGADAIFVSITSSQELFQAPATDGGVSLFDRFMGILPAAFALGCGGLAVMNLFVTHRLASNIWANVNEVSARGLAAKEAHEAMSAIRACNRRYAALMQEREKLLSIDPRAEDIAIANEILGTISRELAPAETWLADQKLRGPSENRFVMAQASLDKTEMSRRIASIRAITLKSILSAIRPDIKGEKS